MNELALFAGCGGGILGGQLLGWQTVAAVEIDPYCRRVLCARQDDGFLNPFPIWDDIRTFDASPWRGIVDIITGGFPCQDISVAGSGRGITGSRSSLWFEMARVVGEIQPEWVFVENSPALRTRGLKVLLQQLADLGYDAEWGVVSAADVGAPHMRKRLWILAHSSEQQRAVIRREAPEPGCGGPISDTGRFGLSTRGSPTLGSGESESRDRFGNLCQNVSDAHRFGRSGPERFIGAADSAGGKPRENASGGSPRTIPDADSPIRDTEIIRSQKWQGERSDTREFATFKGTNWWASEPSVGRVVDGYADRVDQLRGIGNAQVPLAAAAAFVWLYRRFLIA